ncbi:MAG: antitoxin VbhA family protein [Polynucleobacter sp.]|uniref:antitoxin VbhA family protein n=1 Tax=Polynucleobacter sp. 78F-HAINBA TaxID=2689099 RepID=UPI00059C9C4C|nr:antitoxin VbhA family protein [uncultured Polynucleobacter sp.]MBU3590567.1 antitoxin VbhA family protein [Polynucleobacter sp. 78F-HAINBA]
MLTKFSTQSQVRQYDASNAVASARIEGITPTKQLELSLTDYVTGNKSIGQILEETKQRYAANRPK